LFLDPENMFFSKSFCLRSRAAAWDGDSRSSIGAQAQDITARPLVAHEKQAHGLRPDQQPVFGSWFGPLGAKEKLELHRQSEPQNARESHSILGRKQTFAAEKPCREIDQKAQATFAPLVPFIYIGETTPSHSESSRLAREKYCLHLPQWHKIGQ
jgi:hypothetical protein